MQRGNKTNSDFVIVTYTSIARVRLVHLVLLYCSGNAVCMYIAFTATLCDRGLFSVSSSDSTGYDLFTHARARNYIQRHSGQTFLRRKT